MRLFCNCLFVWLASCIWSDLAFCFRQSLAFFEKSFSRPGVLCSAKQILMSPIQCIDHEMKLLKPKWRQQLVICISGWLIRCIDTDLAILERSKKALRADPAAISRMVMKGFDSLLAGKVLWGIESAFELTISRVKADSSRCAEAGVVETNLSWGFWGGYQADSTEYRQRFLHYGRIAHLEQYVWWRKGCSI